MLFDKGVIKSNVILFVIFGLLSLVFGLTGLGAMAIIIGGINIFIALIYFFTKQNSKAKTCLLIGGCLFLVGFALCSSFPLNFN